MVLQDFLDRLNRRVAKMQFGVSKRVRFYNHLMMMFENRVLLIDALREMYSIASKGGKKSGDGYAIILDSCYDAVSQGSTLAEGLRPWINPNEVAVIAAGEQSGDVISALKDAIVMIEAGSKIRGSIVGASIYPLVLLTMLCVLLHIVGSVLVPKLSAVSNPQTWSGPAYILYLLSVFVNNLGIYVLISVIVIGIFIFVSMPLLDGWLRRYLDHIPPWSWYRTIHGSIFMLNVSLLIRSGMMLQSALELLLEQAGSRWLRHRIEGTLDHIAAGEGFGDALGATGYNFPDSEAISYLQLLSRLQGFDQAMAQFARHWLDETIAKVQAAARGFLLGSILMMGGMLILVVLATSDIESAIQGTFSQPTG